MRKRRGGQSIHSGKEVVKPLPFRRTILSLALGFGMMGACPVFAADYIWNGTVWNMPLPATFTGTDTIEVQADVTIWNGQPDF